VISRWERQEGDGPARNEPPLRRHPRRSRRTRKNTWKDVNSRHKERKKEAGGTEEERVNAIRIAVIPNDADQRRVPQSSVLRVRPTNDRIAQRGFDSPNRSRRETYSGNPDGRDERKGFTKERSSLIDRKRVKDRRSNRSRFRSRSTSKFMAQFRAINSFRSSAIRAALAGYFLRGCRPLWLFVEERIPRAETEARSFRFPACELYGL